MAVRATSIVFKAYLAGTLPPAVSEISSLSGNSKLPDLAELREVFNMQYLVRCLEFMYFYSDVWHSGHTDFDIFRLMKYPHYPAQWRRFPECLKDIPGAKNATIHSFRDEFYRAMYRLLLAGAVLARAYIAPLFRAREEGGNFGFFVRNGNPYYGGKYWENLMDSDMPPPTAADWSHIRQFPVYNFLATDWSELGQWRNREYEACFGPFASWIVEDGRKRQQNKPTSPNNTEQPDWAENGADVGAVRELMLLLVAFDQFVSKVENTFRDGSYHPMKIRGSRTVSIVRFGVFHIEEITMPTAIEDLKTGYLDARYHPALEGSEGEDIPLEFDMMEALYSLECDTTTNPHAGDRRNPGPPATLELWHFALRRYLNLGFRSGLFSMPRKPLYMESIWWKEVGRGEIFINPSWAVVQKYTPGRISWAI